MAEIGGSVVGENVSDDCEWEELAVGLGEGKRSGDGMLLEDDTYRMLKHTVYI